MVILLNANLTLMAPTKKERNKTKLAMEAMTMILQKMEMTCDVRLVQMIARNREEAEKADLLLKTTNN